MRRFEVVEGVSKKFWSVDVQGKNLSVHWGRIGTAGQEKTKPCASPGAAEKEAAALVASKVKKGYVEVKSKGSAVKGSTAKGSAVAPPSAALVEAARKKLAKLVPAWFEAERELERVSSEDGTSWLDEEPMTGFLGKPCGEADVAALEVSLGRSLPASYRAYLSLFGDKKTFAFPLGAKQHASKQVKSELAEASDLFDEFSDGDPIADGAIPFLLDGTRRMVLFVPPMKNGEMAVVDYEICEEIERYPNLVAFFEAERKSSLSAMATARKAKAKKGVKTTKDAIAVVLGVAKGDKPTPTALAATLKILGGRLPGGEVPLEATIDELEDRSEGERFVAGLRALKPFPEQLAMRLAETSTDIIELRNVNSPKAAAVAELWFTLEPKPGLAEAKKQAWRDAMVEAVHAATVAKETTLAKRLGTLAARNAPKGESDFLEAAAITTPREAIDALLAADKKNKVPGATKLRRIVDVLVADWPGHTVSSRSIEALRDAAESARVVTALRKLPVPTRSLSILASTAVELLDDKKMVGRAMPVADLLVDLEPKEVCKRRDKNANWLSMLNNAICRAVMAKQRDAAIRLSAIAMRHAGANDNLPHNAACGLVLAKRYEDAVAMCRVAVQNRYRDVKKLATDKDLAPLRSRDDFKALFARKKR